MAKKRKLEDADRTACLEGIVVRKDSRPKQAVETPSLADSSTFAPGNEHISTSSSRGLPEAGQEPSRRPQACELDGASDEPYGRRKKKAKVHQEHVHEVTEVDRAWVESLSGRRLDLIIAIKKVALQRFRTCGDDAYAGVLGPRALRLLEIVLEEFISDQLSEVDGAAPAVEEPRAGEDGCEEEVQGPEQETGEEMEPNSREDEGPK